MNRRELLSMIAAVTGVAMLGANRAMAYLPTATGPNLFTPEDAAFLDEVAETIIPATDTPGAKDAGVGAFMTVFVSDCYTPEEQERFRHGMEEIRAGAQERFGQPFEALSPEDRRGFLQEAAVAARAQAALIAEAQARMAESRAQQPAAGTSADPTLQVLAEEMPQPHWFTLIQQLTLFGFFTSEKGATEVLRYEAVPGEYIGDLPYNGEPAWAT